MRAGGAKRSENSCRSMTRKQRRALFQCTGKSSGTHSGCMQTVQSVSHAMQPGSWPGVCCASTPFAPVHCHSCAMTECLGSSSSLLMYVYVHVWCIAWQVHVWGEGDYTSHTHSWMSGVPRGNQSTPWSPRHCQCVLYHVATSNAQWAVLEEAPLLMYQCLICAGEGADGRAERE